MDEFIENILKINNEIRYEFREIYGFTFVFETSITSLRDKISSAEIKPVGIIYDENDEYYLAPIDEDIQKDAIIKDFVNEILKKQIRNKRL